MVYTSMKTIFSGATCLQHWHAEIKVLSARKRGRRAGWTRSKLERSGDLHGFKAGPVDPANLRGRASQFDLQLTRRESLSVI